MTLLGPQRLTPTLPDVVRAAGIDLHSSSCAPMATITAGWQEREDDDRDLVDALLGNTVNLRLYARAADIFDRDTELAAAHGERGRRLRDLQSLYELRLGHAMDAVYELARRRATGRSSTTRSAPPSTPCVPSTNGCSIAAARCVGEFVERWRPAERDVVAAPPRRGGAILGESCGLAIAGGQVPTLLNRIHLLGVADHVGRPARVRLVGGRDGRHRADRGLPRRPAARTPARPDVRARARLVPRAWSRCPTPAAACTSTTRYASALLARRFAPAVCLGLDDGAHLLASAIADTAAPGRAAPRRRRLRRRSWRRE